MKAIIVFYFFLVVVVPASWVFNLLDFNECDFKAPYRCEVLHGAGLIPLVSVVTVWMDTDGVTER